MNPGNAVKCSFMTFAANTYWMIWKSLISDSNFPEENH